MFSVVSVGSQGVPCDHCGPVGTLSLGEAGGWSSIERSSCYKYANGLFPPTETETETDFQTDSKPNRYIVLCTTFSTGMEMEMETFPDGYCTHFRDGSLSQGQISIPIPYI